MVHDEIADEDAASECIVYAAKHPVTDLHNVVWLKHWYVAVMIAIHVTQTQAVNDSNTCHSNIGNIQSMIAIHVTQTQTGTDSNTCHSNSGCQ